MQHLIFLFWKEDLLRAQIKSQGFLWVLGGSDGLMSKKNKPEQLFFIMNTAEAWFSPEVEDRLKGTDLNNLF